MNSDTKSAFPEFVRVLSTEDQCLLERLLDESVDVIIFGSRAAGVHSKPSDLDILCVGTRERYKSHRLDVVSRESVEVEDRKWLGSELASHIAVYGIVIRGSAAWKEAVRLNEATVSQKERRVVALVDGLWTYWDRIYPEFRRKYLTTIRREVQRLELLRKGIAMPPTPSLDRTWKNEQGAADSWIRSFWGIKTDSAIRDRLLRTTDLIVPQQPFLREHISQASSHLKR
jgi:predicted nucleotidyltransferase